LVVYLTAVTAVTPSPNPSPSPANTGAGQFLSQPLDLTTPVISGEIAMVALFSAALVAALNLVGQRISVELIPSVLRRRALWWLVGLVLLLPLTLALTLVPLPSVIAHVWLPVTMLVASVAVSITGMLAMWRLTADIRSLAALMLLLPPLDRSAAYKSALQRAVSTKDSETLRRLLGGLLVGPPRLGSQQMRISRAQIKVQKLIGDLYARIRGSEKLAPEIQLFGLGLRPGEPVILDQYTSALEWILANSRLDAEPWLLEEIVFSLVGDWRWHRYQLRAYERYVTLLQASEISILAEPTDEMLKLAEAEFYNLPQLLVLPAFDEWRATLCLDLLPRLLRTCANSRSRFMWYPVGYGFMGALAMSSRWSFANEFLTRTLAIGLVSVADVVEDGTLGSSDGIGYLMMSSMFTQALPLALLRIRERAANSASVREMTEEDSIYRAVASCLDLPAPSRVWAILFCDKYMLEEPVRLQFAYRTLARELIPLWESDRDYKVLIDIIVKVVAGALENGCEDQINGFAGLFRTARHFNPDDVDIPVWLQSRGVDALKWLVAGTPTPRPTRRRKPAPRVDVG
jgi:hypothetical protein